VILTCLKDPCPFYMWVVRNFLQTCPIKNRVKYTSRTYVLETLFFSPSVSIRITNDTSILEKDQISTSVKFSVQKLTACHLAPLGMRHMSNQTHQHPLNFQITQTPPHHTSTSFYYFGGKIFYAI